MPLAVGAGVGETVGGAVVGSAVGCSVLLAVGAGSGVEVSLGAADGVGLEVAVADGVADDGVDEGVASCRGVGRRGSVTWLIVVPSPPESELPVASSTPVSTTAARANAASAATSTVRQLR